MRTLARPGWALALVGVLLGSWLCVQLGLWQWHRHEERSANAARIEARYDAQPQALGTVVGEDHARTIAPDEDWTPVSLSGRYGDEELLVRGRTMDKVTGYEVVVPFVDDSGLTVLVDRGWVPGEQSGDEIPAYPSAPSGPLTVTGWLRPSEMSRGYQLSQGLIPAIHVPDAEAQLDTDLLDGYVLLREDGVAERPRALARPGTGTGPHQAYAIQWWLGALALPAMLLAFARRAVSDARLSADPGSEIPGGPAPERRAERENRETAPASSRRRWVWDDEDEEI